jgi:hypothetical protein
MARFTKGTPKPPNSGRRRGVRNKITRRYHRLIAEEDDMKIVDVTVAAAKGGEIAAMALYYRFLRPSLPRFLSTSPNLGRLSDAASSVAFVASVVERAEAGELDAEWTRLFLDAADVYVRLYDKFNLEIEVERHRQLEHTEA